MKLRKRIEMLWNVMGVFEIETEESVLVDIRLVDTIL
jgi:hypothetical protein